MSELAAWYIPAEPLPWVLRSPAGRVWALPNVANAWGKGMRELQDSAPTSDPLPPVLSRVVAVLVGLTAFGPLDESDVTMLGWEMAEERAALEPRTPTIAVVDSIRTHRAHVSTVADVLAIGGLTEGREGAHASPPFEVRA